MLNRRAFLPLLALLLAVPLGCASSRVPASGGERVPGAIVPIDILQINDVYEIGPVEGGKSGGLARVATIRKRLLAENPNTFTVLAGDFLSPSALGTAKVDGQAQAGQQMVAVLNALGVDLVTFGNHEFDLKEDQLLARLKESRFGWTSANVTQANGGSFPGVSTHALLTAKKGDRQVRIGVVSVTLDSNPEYFVAYQDPIDSFRKELDAVKGQADVVMGLTHLAFEQDQALAESIPAIDFILGGHEHENSRAYRGTDFTPILKADSNVRTVYVHHLEYDTAKKSYTFDSRLVVVDDSIPEDRQVAQVVTDWQNKGFAAFKQQGFDPAQQVAVTTVTLDGREGAIRNGSTPLTDLIARAFQSEAQGSELALYNAGSIRIDDILPPGPVTQYDVLRILPFGGKVLTADISGSLLIRTLTQGLANRGEGGFLQSTNVTRDDQGTWRVSGQPLDPDRTYRIAINDYLAAGKEQALSFLKPGPDLTLVTEGRDQRMAVIDQLKREYPIAP